MRIYFKEGDTNFTNINPDELPEELQTVYKSMLADYTRKTQELADMRKQFTEKEQHFEEKLSEYGAAAQERDQWRQWYASISADAATEPEPDDPSIINPDGDQDMSTASLKKIAALERTIQELQGKLDGFDTSLRSTADRTGRMFAFHTQLGDLMREHPELDRDKLVKHAVDNGFTDLKVAYDDLFRDDIINNEVEKRLAERLKEERAKHITGHGRQVVVRPGKDTPSSFDEATQAILDQKAADGTLDLGG